MRLLRPIGVAHALLDRPEPSPSVTEIVFGRVLASQAQSDPTVLFARVSDLELAAAVEEARRRLVPFIKANPGSTLSCQQWLVLLAKHAIRSVIHSTSSAPAHTLYLTELRALRDELAGGTTEQLAALERDLAALMDRSSNPRRRRQPASSNLEDLDRGDRSIGPDAALLTASLVSTMCERLIPFARAHACPCSSSIPTYRREYLTSDSKVFCDTAVTRPPSAAQPPQKELRFSWKRPSGRSFGPFTRRQHMPSYSSL